MERALRDELAKVRDELEKAADTEEIECTSFYLHFVFKY